MADIIHHKTLREQVADTIRKKILHHELEPGMRITESELAAKFHVSHGPIREAMRQLEQEGLIEYTRNVGCSVRNVSLRDVIEVLTIRGSYELTAVRACSGHFSEKALDRMEDILDSMKHMDDSDYTESIIFDNQFHKVLISESRMPYLVNAWDALDFVTFFTFYKQMGAPDVVAKKQYDVHKRIFDVYKTGGCREICGAVHEHYKNSIDRILCENHLKKTDFPFSFDVIRPY